MTSQISLLYPVKILVGPAQKQELEAYPSSNLAGKGSQYFCFFWHIHTAYGVKKLAKVIKSKKLAIITIETQGIGWCNR